MAQITDPAKLREIAERNQRLGFGSIDQSDGIDKFVRGDKSTKPGTGFDIGPSIDPDLFNTKSKNTIVSGSENVREEETVNKNIGNDITSDIDDFDTTTSMDDIKKQIGYRDPYADFTEGEQSNIDRQAEEAGAEYDELIATAEEAKRSGLPKALISAGERGGFMSTQFAGLSAIIPGQSGDFIGAGGELSNIKSAYDRNIQNMEDAKMRAVSKARTAAEEAIRTGKSQSNKDAQEFFKLAQDANAKSIALAQAKVDYVDSYHKEKEARVEYGQEQEDRDIEGVAVTIAQTIQDMTSEEALSYVEKIATDQNVDINRLSSAVNEAIKDMAAESFFSGSNIVSLMKDTPAGEPRTIVDPNTGTTYTFEGTKDPDTYNTTSDDGTVRVFDKNTSKIISKTEPGAGKTKTQASSVTINAAGARTPVYKDGAQIGYQSYNDKTGKTSFTSFSHEYNSSEEGILPSGSTLGTFAAGNPDKNGTEPTIDWEEAGE